MEAPRQWTQPARLGAYGVSREDQVKLLEEAEVVEIKIFHNSLDDGGDGVEHKAKYDVSATAESGCDLARGPTGTSRPLISPNTATEPTNSTVAENLQWDFS